MQKLNTIMLVDDSEIEHVTSRYAVEDFDESIEVFDAYDGKEALELIQSNQCSPDLIFLDINMPGMDGHAFLEAYAPLAQSRTTLVVMLTSSDQKSDRDSCARYEFVKDYITKPLEIEHIETLAERLFQSK